MVPTSIFRVENLILIFEKIVKKTAKNIFFIKLHTKIQIGSNNPMNHYFIQI